MAWIVIKKADLSIVVMSGASADMVEGGTTYDPTLEEFCNERGLVVDEHYKITHSDLNIIKYGADIADNGDGTYSATAKAPPAPTKAKKLVISTDAVDVNPKNGRYEITGDGVSSASITVQLKIEDEVGSGNFIDDAVENVEIDFVTDHGKLSARSALTDANGSASITITSSAETVWLDVKASAGIYGYATLPMEFIP